MADQLTPVQIEYRHRRSQIFRVVILFGLVPFVLEATFSYISAPPVLLSIGMAVTMVGIMISVAYVWRVWECPACGIKLWSGGVGTLGGKCLGCQIQLIPRQSKGGQLYP